VDWEEQMKKLRMVLLAGLLIAALCAPAHAWEFSMTGNFQYTYEYFAQGGPNGFFGQQNTVSPGLTGLAGGAAGPNWFGTNFWAGSRLLSGIQYGVVSGLNTDIIWSRMVMNPEIRVNPAIRLRGQYWIGGFQTWAGGAANGYDAATGNGFGNVLGSNTDQGSSVYLLQQTGNAITRPISTGQWNLLWATAQTPWGILVFGKRPFAFGMGMNADGEHTLSSESFALVAPYGPLRIGAACHPWRQGVFIDNTRNLAGGVAGNSATAAAIFAGGGGLGTGATNTSGTSYPKFWDASGQRLQLPQVGMFVTYSNGPLDAGVIYEHWQNHQGPESAGTQLAQLTNVTTDEQYEDGMAYVKYNNGRFFFNAEVGWWRWNTRFQKPAILPAGVGNEGGVAAMPGLGSIYQPVNNEGWNFASEIGALCGPGKVSAIYAFSPGPDRRQGIWISRSEWNDIAYGNVPCNVMLFLPYSYLMTYQYATGLNFRNSLGEGGLTDATGVGARLDYAVAANLNWYGSFFWAWRNSGAWPWGTLTIDAGAAATLNGMNAVQVFGINVQGGPAPQNTGAIRAPNIPDNNLGWEFTTGVDWKLLEGLTMNLRGAFWQPGEWFKFACIDRQIAQTTILLPSGHLALRPFQPDGTEIGAGFGINPAKTIDPIWAFTGSLNVDF